MQEFDGHFELIDPNEIHFDRKYQRAQKWDLIGAIAKNPIWPAFGIVICAKREYAGGLYYALDGQQRVTGVLTCEKPPKRVPAIWFPVKSPAEEAALFDIINTNRKAVQALEKFTARLTSENPVYERIASAVERAGFTIGASASPRSVAAVDKLLTIYNDVAGEEGVYIGLAAWGEAWPDDAPSASLLLGLADVMASMSSNGGLSVERLSKALARTTPSRILRKAEEIKYDQGVSKRVAIRKAIKALAKV